MKSYETKVKERMMQKVDHNLTGGLFKGQAYSHIFQKLEYNFIDGKYPIKKAIKGSLDSGDIKYHYANHLNSSQTMCISYFKKFFEKKEYEFLLSEILMILKIDVSGTYFTDAIFEYVPNASEQTNFDFYLRLANDRSISWEIKFTESEFGGTTKSKGYPDRYINKWTDIYIPMLRDCAYYNYPDVCCDDYQCIKTGTLTNDCTKHNECSIYEFYKYYQIRRNILYGKQEGDYVIFLTPKENYHLDDGRRYIEEYNAIYGKGYIRNIYWEELISTTLQVVSCNQELFKYYTEFKEKYF